MTIKDKNDLVIDTTYYRYYEGNSATGFKHGIKYVLMPESYARLAAAYASPQAQSDAIIAQYADHYFEYDPDANFMVTKEKAQGAGCACDGGLGEFTFDYHDRSTEPGYTPGYNSWKMRTTETLPDGNQNIVYTNEHGQVMLEAFHNTSTGQKWATYYHYDSDGRVDFRAEPSAVTSYDDAKADLLDLVEGNYVHLNDATGNITDYTYYPTTGVPAGGAPGYLSDVAIRTGELGTIASGTKIPQSHTTYETINDGVSQIYLPDIETNYAGLNSGFPQQTNHSYLTSGLQVTYSTSAGPTGDLQAALDAYGRPTWQMDQRGFIHYTEYDTLTGAVIKTITDVDTSLVAGEPAFYTTPAGGGVHAVTMYEVDGLGRQTKITDPNENVTRIVYKDAAHESRIYEGLIPGGNWPTKPIVVIRDDRTNGYTETLTMAQEALVVDDVFTGNEPIENVLSLSRTFYNSAGQVVAVRHYFNLTGLTYTSSDELGTLNENYYERTLAHDHRGRVSREKRGDGTIYRTVYDGLGRTTSEWIGTNDVPETGTWSETNSAGMVRVAAYTYDGGGTGDSRLTSVIDALDRTTTYGYDFRGRLASTTLPDPDGDRNTNDVAVYRQDYDNLGRITATTDATGLFNEEHQTSYYYSFGVYEQAEHPDPDGAGPLNQLVTSKYFDARGQLIQTTTYEGNTLAYLVSSFAYDGAGRLISSSEPDGDLSDSVLPPTTTYAYDDVGNLTTVTDPRGVMTINTYDRANRLESSQQSSPLASTFPTTYYGHDATGGVLTSTLTDPVGNITTWHYDALGRVATETNALNKTRHFEYDGANRLTKKTDRLDRITRYEYNHFDQMTAEKWYDGEILLRTLSYAYDDAGQLTGTSDPGAEYTYVPDRMGRVKSQTQAIDGHTPAIEYVNQYNPDGFRTELISKIGGVNDFKNTYVPDNLQRLVSLIQDANGGNAVAQKRVDFAYTGGGQLASISRYAGTTAAELVANSFYRYDGFGRLDQLVHTMDTQAPTSGWGASPLAAYAIGYEPNASRIASINSFRDGLSQFYYDDSNQLTTAYHAAESGQANEAYAFDDNGNRMSSEIGINNQVLSDGTYRYAYDAEGNRIRRTEIATGLYSRYAYDYRIRLTSVVDVNPELAVTNPAWGQATGGSSALATVDMGSNVGWTSTTITGDYFNDLVWDSELEEYVEITIEPTVELKVLNAVEGGAIEIYARIAYENNPSPSNLEYWIGTDTPVGISVTSSVYTFVTSIPTTDDSVAGGDQTITIHFGNDDPQATTSLQATVFDNEVLVAFDTAVHSATEGDDVLLAIAANFPSALEYRLEDVTALQPGKYSGPTSWTAVGNTSTVAIPTYHTSGYDGVLSFKIVLRVAGDAASEVVLEADIYDLVDTTIQSVDYAYDTFNQLVRRTHDADGSVGLGTPTERFFSWEGGQIALQFDGTETADLSHRYLNGPAVDQIMADEVVTSLGNPGETLWGLVDHLSTIRDVAVYDVGTHATSIANHRVFDTFGILVSQTNANFSIAFGFTGVYFDTATTLQFHRNRWYDPATGRWLSEDPIGFAGGQANLSVYVGNHPTMATDPSGLAEGWKWNWHHMLDQAIFTPEFMGQHGLNIDINSAEYGWMLRAMDHTGAGGIHPEGWSKDWTDRIHEHERNGTKITKDMVDAQLGDMMKNYNLCDRGFAAKFPYGEADKAYKAAERMARQKAANALGDAAGKLGRGRARGGRGGGKSRGAGGPIIGTLIGFGIALGGGFAFGSDDPWGDALESLDPFEPSMMGHSELTPQLLDELAAGRWQAYQNELNGLDAQRRACPAK